MDEENKLLENEAFNLKNQIKDNNLNFEESLKLKELQFKTNFQKDQNEVNFLKEKLEFLEKNYKEKEQFLIENEKNLQKLKFNFEISEEEKRNVTNDKIYFENQSNLLKEELGNTIRKLKFGEENYERAEKEIKDLIEKNMYISAENKKNFNQKGEYEKVKILKKIKK